MNFAVPSPSEPRQSPDRPPESSPGERVATFCHAELFPLQGLLAASEPGVATAWAVTTDDPQFGLRFPHGVELAAGYYHIVVETPDPADSLLRLVGPRLYFDYGNGFHEADSIPLGFRLCRNGLQAHFILKADAHRVRFDPTTRWPERLDLGGIRVSRSSKSGYYRALVWRLLRSKLTNPRGLIQSLAIAGRILVQDGLRGVAAAAVRADRQAAHVGAHVPSSCRRDYDMWVDLFDTPSPADLARLRLRAADQPNRPLISVVMPTYNTPAHMLREALESVLEQTYDRWELCIADDNSSKPHVREMLQTFAGSDPRIRLTLRDENGHIAAATNTALALASGDWVAFLDHDDTLAPHALHCIADAAVRNPAAQLIYSDEDKLDASGKRCDPYFKCDWNLELFRSHNLITHLAAYRTERIRQLQGLREGFDGAQDYDLALRFIENLEPAAIIHVPHVLYHWRVHPESTAAAGTAKPYAMLAGERALNQHLRRSGTDGCAELIGFGFRVDYAVPEPRPLVSIIIPTRNARQLVEQCIASIVTKTTYRPYEILLVDNGSDEESAVRAFATLADLHGVRVLRDDRPFNYSALNNAAAREARGDVLVLLNNDIEVITPDWLTRLVAVLQQPAVGAVGAKLLYPDGTVQHGGVVLGLGGLAAHAHTGLPRSSPGYVGRAALQQEVSAVTAACLAVYRELFFEVGGLDEQDLPIAYNDVDFCLKLRARGLRNVWIPFVELYHHESATRGYETSPEKLARFAGEQEVMRRRWQSWIDYDPAYSPNLTDGSADFSLAWPPRVPRPWH